MTYKHTRYASYLGYVTQAIVINLAPLLFVTFVNEFRISLELISLLIGVNFGTQIITDIVAAKYVDVIGYRKGAVLAHVLCFLGLVGMGTLPFILPNAYIGLVISIIVSAVGGGLIEVLITPIVEALPSNRKEAGMSLLHSFYCFGQVGVVLFSTLFFVTVGTKYWYLLSVLWSLIPLANAFLFLKVPLCELVEEDKKVPMKQVLRQGMFWAFVLLMLASGASELAMSQWASLFAETGLHVSKTLGDLLGPCAFAVLMGLARVFYGVAGDKINLKNALMFSSLLCIISYLLAIFSKNALVSLFGCALTGLSVGLMWPGGISLAAKQFRSAGTTMFAFLALAGDFGCISGPGIVGLVSGKVQEMEHSFFHSIIRGRTGSELGLRAGLFAAILFPALLFFILLFMKIRGTSEKETNKELKK